uniref:Uncharacterized protein n=1 Tax=Leersia perrieri TaxID=77586 RepID=A0A0D9WZL2_9ORYZ
MKSILRVWSANLMLIVSSNVATPEMLCAGVLFAGLVYAGVPDCTLCRDSNIPENFAEEDHIIMEQQDRAKINQRFIVPSNIILPQEG